MVQISKAGSSNESVSAIHQDMEKSSNNRHTICDFEVIDHLGTGGFGYVSRILSASDNNMYAIKIVDSRFLGNYPFAELNIFYRFKHPYLSEGYEICTNDDNPSAIPPTGVGLITNLATTDLGKHIFSQIYESDDIVRYIYNIVKGIYVLHRQGIGHFDIKSTNVFLTFGTNIEISTILRKSQTNIRLADFGTARHLRDPTQLIDVGYVFGTFPYLSHEAIRGNYSLKTDIWALGILILEILYGQLPISGNDLTEIDQSITNLFGSSDHIYATVNNATSLWFSENAREQLNKLLFGIFQPDKNRLTIEEVIESEFFLSHGYIRLKESEFNYYLNPVTFSTNLLDNKTIHKAAGTLSQRIKEWINIDPSITVDNMFDVADLYYRTIIGTESISDNFREIILFSEAAIFGVLLDSKLKNIVDHANSCVDKQKELPIDMTLLSKSVSYTFYRPYLFENVTDLSQLIVIFPFLFSRRYLSLGDEIISIVSKMNLSSFPNGSKNIKLQDFLNIVVQNRSNLEKIAVSNLKIQPYWTNLFEN